MRSEMEASRELERVLVRQDVNTQKLSFRLYGGKARFSGELTRRQGKPFKDQTEVKQLEKQVKRVDGIRTTEWDLKNWKKEHGEWVNEKQSKDDKYLRDHQEKVGSGNDIELEW